MSLYILDNNKKKVNNKPIDLSVTQFIHIFLGCGGGGGGGGECLYITYIYIYSLIYLFVTLPPLCVPAIIFVLFYFIFCFSTNFTCIVYL